MTNTINLFKTGKITALFAKDLEPEVITLWNYGFVAEVLGVSIRTDKNLTIELKYLNMSTVKTYKTNRPMRALVGPLRIRFK